MLLPFVNLFCLIHLHETHFSLCTFLAPVACACNHLSASVYGQGKMVFAFVKRVQHGISDVLAARHAEGYKADQVHRLRTG